MRLVISRSWLALWLSFALLLENVLAAETSLLKGKVTDYEGKPVEDAVIFIYQSANTRRQPDFISPKSDKDGRYSIALPPGRYRATARVMKDQKIGPVPLGGKHSGQPEEIDITTDNDSEKDFVVADIKEVAGMSKRTKEEVLRISGRIVDSDGNPVKMAYAIANKNDIFSEVPDYLSGWTDETGRYTLYLPRGKYYIGFATTFPPEKSRLTFKEMIIEGDKSDIDIFQ